MVYHYFGSKAALFEAALAEVYKRIEEIEFDAVEQGRSPREKLSRLLESYFKFLDAEPEFTRMLQWENLEKGRHLTRENHLLTKNPFLLQFQAIVRNDAATGQFRRDLDVTHLLIQFIGLCSIYHSNRFSLSQSLGLDLGDPKVKARALNQVLTLVFEGICKAESPAAAKEERVTLLGQGCVNAPNAEPASRNRNGYDPELGRGRAVEYATGPQSRGR